jgi:geranylgeranyl pyrophosphate synthase
MEYYQNKINEYLNDNFIKKFPEPIINKIKYLLEDGKRIRPVLYLILSDVENISGEDNNNILKEKKQVVYDLACIIETLHNLSLVLDDLPDMDNDLFRRNKPTFHSKYGINYTNFFVYYIFNKLGTKLDYLLEYEFNENNLDFMKDIKYIFQYNLEDLIDGQYTDLSWNKYLNNKLISYDFTEEKEIINELLNKIENSSGNSSGNNVEEVSNNESINNNANYNKLMKNIDLNLKKTGSLFNLSISTGFIIQLWIKNINFKNFSSYNNIFKNILKWSYIFGYMFQISDDILDVIPDNETQKPNICSIIGLEKTKKLLSNGIEWLKINIDIINENLLNINNEMNITINKDAINEIIDLIGKRNK